MIQKEVCMLGGIAGSARADDLPTQPPAPDETSPR